MICRNAASSPAPAPSPVSRSQRARARPELGCRGAGCGRGVGCGRGARPSAARGPLGGSALPPTLGPSGSSPWRAVEFGPQIVSGSTDLGHCPSFRYPPMWSHKATRVPEPTRSAPIKPKLETPRLLATSPKERKTRAPHTGFLCPKTHSRGEEHFGKWLGKGVMKAIPTAESGRGQATSFQGLNKTNPWCGPFRQKVQRTAETFFHLKDRRCLCVESTPP